MGSKFFVEFLHLQSSLQHSYNVAIYVHSHQLCCNSLTEIKIQLYLTPEITDFFGYLTAVETSKCAVITTLTYRYFLS